MFHTLIVWSEAKSKKDLIFEDLSQKFDIYKIFKFHWETSDFMDNLMAFYSHSQKHLEENQYRNLLMGKMDHCGIDDFYVVVFEDNNPKMEHRETSSGKDIVNINVFDKKTEYRNLTGGGHKIHTSNSDWETNKDLTVLFGANTEDFKKKYSPSKCFNDIETYTDNCLGTKGFKSISQLFYLLNNTINYCVLRNHEMLPEEYTSDEHGDIDLLVENKNYVKYLTRAKDVYNIPYRVYHTINIAGQEIPFDFRYVGDDYYDKEWEKDILSARKDSNRGFYVPSDEDQFYSLLYHAYIQKGKVADDYHVKLEHYANNICVYYEPNIESVMGLLDQFLLKKNYDYVQPVDRTVFYNENNLNKSLFRKKFGKLVSKLNLKPPYNVPFFSVVYERESSFYKRGSEFLIKNEVSFLRQLSSYDYFQKVLSTGCDEGGCFMETKRVNGENLKVFFQNKKNHEPKIVRAVIKEIIDILGVLVDNKIVHRDFMGQNLLIDKKRVCYKVSLIDFGWAISTDNIDNCLKPQTLGGDYKSPEGFSDFYTLGKVFESIWAHPVPYITRIKNYLMSVLGADYKSEDLLKRHMETLKCLADKRFSMHDRMELFAYRHKTFGRYYYRVKRKSKRLIKRIIG